MTLEEHLTGGPIKDEPLYLTSGRVARRYAKTVRTLDRWLRGGLFPEPDLIIRSRRYWTKATLDRFDAEHKARTRVRSGSAEDRPTS